MHTCQPVTFKNSEIPTFLSQKSEIRGQEWYSGISGILLCMAYMYILNDNLPENAHFILIFDLKAENILVKLNLLNCILIIL